MILIIVLLQLIYDNYRPILESAVCQELQGYLEVNCLLSKIQFGFCKNHSTQLSVM